LPQEDQGTMLISIQLPPGATLERTHQVVLQVEKYIRAQPEVLNMVAVEGFSFTGQGQNAAFSFVTLKPWDERKGAEHTAPAVVARAARALSSIKDAFIDPLNPPVVPELGISAGFDFRLQDRSGKGHAALLAARNQMLGMARESKLLAGVRPDGLEDAAQLQIDIDRDKAAAQGLSFGAINGVISATLGSAYVNDFPNAGRMQRVIVQADAPARMQPEDILKITVTNAQGQAVPLSSFASTRWITGQMQSVRYNGYPAMKIAGAPAPGLSTGEAMAEVERLAAKLPEGFGYEWTGISREEKLAGNQAMILYGFAILAVVLALAALYESWSIPLAVILVVPLGVLGVVLAVWGRGLTNDVYFQVGLITIIGLSAKNAILIIEFAKDLQAQGMSVAEAALGAAHLRFRPIIMTSLAFLLGVLPLAIASGAGSAGQRDIGTGVMGGIVVGTTLAVFWVPIFFVVVRRVFKTTARERERFAEHAAQAGITPEAAQQYLRDAEEGMSEKQRRALHEGAAPPPAPKEPQ
jgi:multidrug efflux pump